MDGLLIIDKPAGLTSHDVVARVRRILREKRVGHTGTLDPFATGVMVVLVGRATRLAQFLSGAEKEYEATIRFGYATNTGDATGQPKEVSASLPEDNESPPANDESPREESKSLRAGSERLRTERERLRTERERLRTERESPKPSVRGTKPWTSVEIEAALSDLRGPRLQVPPMYSAKKVLGRKLYELARRGLEIERAAVPVFIHRLEALNTGDAQLLRAREDGTIDMDVRVVCSAGTYIRVLAEEIGERLKTGAHLSSLRRTRAGQFSLDAALTLDELQEREARDILLAPGAALSFLPFVHLTADETRRAKQGARLRAEAAAAFCDGARVRLLDDSGSLVAVGVYEAETQMVHPRVVLAP
jgi:tRNA pseudouridine55 synthase